MPWYVLWILPFAAGGRGARRRQAAVVVPALPLLTLAPITGWLDARACRCTPCDAATDQRPAAHLRQHPR